MAKVKEEKTQATGLVRPGLGLISFGIVINFVIYLIQAIFKLVKYVPKEGGKVENAFSIVLWVALIAVIIGLIFCLFSGQKHFRTTLLIYIVIILTDVIFFAIKKNADLPGWLIVIELVLLALAHLAFLYALKDLSGNSFLAGLLTFACIAMYLGACILAVLGNTAFKASKETYEGIAYTLISIEDIVFLIAIVFTNKAIKKQKEIR